MSSIFVHFRAVRDVFFDYKYFNFISSCILSDSFIKLLIVFDLRKKILLKKPLIKNYFQKKRGFIYFFLFEDIYNRSFSYVLNLLFVPLSETFSSKCFSYFRPFRNNSDLFSCIKNNIYTNFNLISSIMCFRFMLYFSGLTFTSWFFYNQSCFSIFGLRFFDYFSSSFLFNITYYFYSFVFYGLFD